MHLMSSVLQVIQGRLNDALNTLITPQLDVSSRVSPVISLSSQDSADTIFSQGNILKQSTNAPAVGAVLNTTPALDEGDYDIFYQISTPIQAAAIDIAIRVNTRDLIVYRLPSTTIGNLIERKLCLKLNQGDTVNLEQLLAIGTSTFQTTLMWKKRLINT